MIEWAIPIALGLAAFVPKKSGDKAKIQKIFDTVGYGVPDKERKKVNTPKFVKKVPIVDSGQEIGIKYFYRNPIGFQGSLLGEDEKRKGFFKDSLERPVVIEYKQENENNPKKYIQISVFHKELDKFIPYKNVLKHEPKKLKNGKEVMEWLLPLGKTLEGYIWHNFDHIPHMTVAGTTRFGKTVFLKLLMTYLIETHGEDVEFYIIDLKGGLEFKKYECIRQVKAVARNVNEAHDLLFYLTNEQTEVEVKNKKGQVVKTLEFPLGQMQLDEEEFLKKGWSNIVDTPLKRRRFIIVDEAAQLAPDKFMKDDQKMKMMFCQYALSELARIGGALGYRLIFATQYPTADTLPRQIKQNADGKVTFRLPSGYASEVAIDDQGAEKLPSDFKGRALYKTHELKELQVPFITDKEMWDIFRKYQEPTILKGEVTNVIEYAENTKTGEDSPNTKQNEVCNKGTFTIH